MFIAHLLNSNTNGLNNGLNKIQNTKSQLRNKFNLPQIQIRTQAQLKDPEDINTDNVGANNTTYNVDIATGTQNSNEDEQTIRDQSTIRKVSKNRNSITKRSNVQLRKLDIHDPNSYISINETINNYGVQQDINNYDEYSSYNAKKQKKKRYVNNGYRTSNYHLKRSYGENFRYGLTGNRNIILREIPIKMNMKTVISRVSGGPLESIRFVEKSRDVEVSFIEHEDAECFFNKSINGLFIVNGIPIYPEWKRNLISENNPRVFSITRCFQVSDDIYYESRYMKARRCLSMTQIQQLSQEDIVSQVQRDFGKYGRILNISSPWSGKIVVEFEKMESSIKTFRQLRRINSEIGQKYLNWRIDYTHDPCELR